MTASSLGGKTDAGVQTDRSVDRPSGFSRRTALSMIGVGAAGLAASPTASGAPDERCFTVNGGSIEGRLTSQTTTEGTIKGAGPLNGSTALAIEEIVPSAGLSGVPAETVSYTGVFEITTDHGALTLRDVGIFDSDVSTDGEFTSRGRVLEGTGRWKGATGVLFFWGDTDADGTFTAEANGTVCVSKR